MNIIANTIRINMQAVTYFWHNTTNRMAFGDQLQDQRWIWGIGKIIANVTFTLDKIPLISNSFKVILFQEKEEFQTLWPILLIPIHALWMIFIYSSEVHAEKVWRQHIELSFLSSKQLLLLHRIHAYSIGDDSYPNPNSLSLSLSLSLILLCLCCDLHVSSFFYSGSISLIIQIVTLTLETLRVALNTKTFISIP